MDQPTTHRRTRRGRRRNNAREMEGSEPTVDVPPGWAKHVMLRPIEVKRLERGAGRHLPAKCYNYGRLVRGARAAVQYEKLAAKRAAEKERLQEAGMSSEEAENAAAQLRGSVYETTAEEAAAHAFQQVVKGWKEYDGESMMTSRHAPPREDGLPHGLKPQTEEELAATERLHEEELEMLKAMEGEEHEHEETSVFGLGAASPKGEIDDEVQQLEEQGGAFTDNHNNVTDSRFMDGDDATTYSAQQAETESTKANYWYSQLVDLQAQHEKLTSDLNLKKADYDKLRGDQNIAEEHINDANNEIEKLKSELEEAKADKEKSGSNVLALNKTLKDHEARLQTMQAASKEMGQLLADAQLAASTNADLQSQMSKLQAANEKLQANYSAIEQDKALVDEKLEAIEHSVRTVASAVDAEPAYSIEDLCDEVSHLRTKLQEYKREEHYNLHDETRTVDDDLRAQPESLGEALGNESDTELDEDVNLTAIAPVFSTVNFPVVFEMEPELPAVTNAVLAAELSAERANTATLTTKLAVLQDKHNGLTNELKEAKDDYLKLKDDHNTSQRTASEYEEASKRKDSALALHEQKADKLRQHNNTISVQVQEARRELDERTRQHADVQRDLQAERQLMEQKNAQIAQLEQELQSVRSTVAAQTTQIKGHTAELEATRKNVSDLTAKDQELDKARVLAEDLTRDRDSLQRQLAAERASNATASTDKALLEEKLRASKNKNIENENLEVELRDKTARSKELSKAIGAQQQDLSAKLEAEKKIVVEVNAKLEAEKKNAAELKVKLETERKNVAELNAKLEAQKKSAAEVGIKLETEQKNAADLDAKLETEKKSAADLKTKLETEQKNATALSAKLETEKKNAADLKVKLEAEKKHAATTETEMRKLEIEIKTHLKTIGEQASKNHEQEKKLENSATELNEAHSKIQASAEIQKKFQDEIDALNQETAEHRIELQNSTTQLEEILRDVQASEQKFIDQLDIITQKTAENDDQQRHLEKSAIELDELRNEVKTLKEITTIEPHSASDTAMYWLPFLLIAILSLVVGRALLAPRITQHGLYVPAIQYSPILGAMESWIGVNTLLGG